MKRSVVVVVIILAVIAVLGWATWLTVNVANGNQQAAATTNDADESTGSDNGNPTNGATQWLNSCDSEKREQVTQLVENGQAVNRAWMFLDKNESEVAAGDLWTIEIPTGVYGQVFVPTTGMTYEVRGPGHVRVGAATFWCNDTGDQPHHGQMRALNATRLPEPIGDWVNINLP